MNEYGEIAGHGADWTCPRFGEAGHNHTECPVCNARFDAYVSRLQKGVNAIQAVMLIATFDGYSIQVIRDNDIVKETHKLMATGCEELKTDCIHGNFEDEPSLPDDLVTVLGDLHEPALALLKQLQPAQPAAPERRSNGNTGRH